MSYGEVASEIFTLHTLFDEVGLKKGDKIAINAAGSANWGKIFMATVTGGYMATVLFNGFLPTDTQRMVDHSDSRLLYTEKSSFNKMDFEAMPKLLAAIDIKTGLVLASRGEFGYLYEHRRRIFAQKYPMGISPEDVIFPKTDLNQLCCIFYTSGSTGTPKGVMLSISSLSNNVEIFISTQPYHQGDRYLSILPLSHIFGLVADLLSCLCMGMHITILGMPPISKVLKEALCIVKPRVIMMVPLVLTKIVEYAIGEFIHSKTGEERLAAYKEHPDFCTALNIILTSALGGRVELIMTGGAAIPAEVERLLVNKLHIPLVTGYGMTECGPLISIGRLGDYKLKSAGFIVEGMEAKINSTDPRNIAGELLVRGTNLCKGYYKNGEANTVCFTLDGWFHTGDLGILDNQNHLFLVGRCKSMLLSTNGQNIFPEEIELILNTLPYVGESLIVQRDNHLAAIIVPDIAALERDNIDNQSLMAVMNENIRRLNDSIPAYESIAAYELRFAPFDKTPKGSIKRFLYA